MIFKVKLFSGSFKFSIKGTGNVKIIINNKFIKSLSLPPNYINVCSKEYNNDSNVYKIRIENIDAKNITIGPVIDGEILEIESWGDLDIVYLDNIFARNENHEVIVPDHIPKSLKNLSYLLYNSSITKLKGMEKWDVLT